MTEELDALWQVIQVLDSLPAPYFVGGSIASISYGTIRTTLDADIITQLKEPDIAVFSRPLMADYYVDPGMIQDAIRRHGCFNLIHLKTMFKIDVFVPERTPFLHQQFDRRQHKQVGPYRIALSSPEDLILAKLAWYWKGNEISERQWTDVQGVLKVQGDTLDFGYLETWANSLAVNDLLTRAREEAGSWSSPKD